MEGGGGFTVQQTYELLGAIHNGFLNGTISGTVWERVPAEWFAKQWNLVHGRSWKECLVQYERIRGYYASCYTNAIMTEASTLDLIFLPAFCDIDEGADSSWDGIVYESSGREKKRNAKKRHLAEEQEQEEPWQEDFEDDDSEDFELSSLEEKGTRILKQSLKWCFASMDKYGMESDVLVAPTKNLRTIPFMEYNFGIEKSKIGARTRAGETLIDLWERLSTRLEQSYQMDVVLEPFNYDYESLELMQGALVWCQKSIQRYKGDSRKFISTKLYLKNNGQTLALLKQEFGVYTVMASGTYTAGAFTKEGQTLIEFQKLLVATMEELEPARPPNSRLESARKDEIDILENAIAWCDQSIGDNGTDDTFFVHVKSVRNYNQLASVLLRVHFGVTSAIVGTFSYLQAKTGDTLIDVRNALIARSDNLRALKSNPYEVDPMVSRALWIAYEACKVTVQHSEQGHNCQKLASDSNLKLYGVKMTQLPKAMLKKEYGLLGGSFSGKTVGQVMDDLKSRLEKEMIEEEEDEESATGLNVLPADADGHCKEDLEEFERESERTAGSKRVCLSDAIDE